MRSYVPNTREERAAQLKTIGVDSIEELFRDVPEDMRKKEGLKLDHGKSEIEVRRRFMELAAKNNTSLKIFRGAGAYNHYIPSLIPQLVSRSEFYTAYTPYQAEMSQGMLQSIFEYQSLICRLTGMGASNASVYDGATAAAETMNMLCSAKRKNKFLLSAGLHPEVIETVKTYAHCRGVELVIVPLDETGAVDKASLVQNLEGSAGFIAAYPNFYGCVEDLSALAGAVHDAGALFAVYTNPISLGLLKRPGDAGADVVIGDCQPLGMPLLFGGPYAGFMACTEKLTRNLPGRIAGETVDHDGNRAYVLTLQAREQHIRRDKASSNICSNQMLCAIMASMYLACMGPDGMHDVATQCTQKAHYLADGISHIKGMKLRYSKPFFNEFVTDCDVDPEKLNNALKKRGFMGGLPLARLIDGERGMLWCATELSSREDIDALLKALEESLEEVRA